MRPVLAWVVVLLALAAIDFGGVALKVVDVAPPKDEECSTDKPKRIAILGASGETGQTVVDYLLSQNHEVHVVVKPGSPWRNVTDVKVREVADFENLPELAKAFTLVDAAFVAPPLPYKADDFLKEAKKIIDNIKWALEAAKVPKVVMVSSIGAHLDPATTELGYIAASHYMEKVFEDYPFPLTFVRAAWLIDNFRPLARAVATKQGVLPSLILPLKQKREMLTSFDLGVWCAKRLLEAWSGVKAVELQGPAMVSPQDVADAITKTLTRKEPVKAVAVNDDRFKDLMKSFLGPNAMELWKKALKGISDGTIGFEGGVSKTILGETSMEEYIATWFPSEGAALDAEQQPSDQSSSPGSNAEEVPKV